MTTLTRSEIVERLANILEEVAGVNPSDIAEDKRFDEDLDVDDLSMVEIGVAAEEVCRVKVPDWGNDPCPFKTVGDLVNHIVDGQQ